MPLGTHNPLCSILGKWQVPRSQERRQPAIALSAFLSMTAHKMESNSHAIAKHFFQELYHFSDRLGGGHKFQKFQQEVEESMKSIATNVRKSQKGLSLPEGFRVIDAVEAHAQY